MAGLLALPLPTQTGTTTCTMGPGQLGAEPGPTQPAEARKGVPAHWGEGVRQDATCTSSLAQGALSTLLGSVSCTWQDHGLPQPRVVGSCSWCQTPWGTQPYTSALAPPPWPRPLSTSGKAALYALLPLQLRPRPLSSLRRVFWDTGD